MNRKHGLAMRTMDFRWAAPPKYADRLRQCLESWKNCPYMLGQQVKGVGVDCVRFVTGVCDEMYRQPYKKFPLIAGESCINATEASDKVFRQLLEMYPCDVITVNKDTPTEVIPGDLICCGPKGGTYGHAMVVGVEPKTFYHATTFKVTKSGCSFMDYGVYSFKELRRMQHRERWI